MSIIGKTEVFLRDCEINIPVFNLYCTGKRLKGGVPRGVPDFEMVSSSFLYSTKEMWRNPILEQFVY
jgi:hypothetical protein